MPNPESRERNLPPILLTVLYIPVMIVAAPLALGLAQLTSSKAPLVLIPGALVAAYGWAIPRIRRWRP